MKKSMFITFISLFMTTAVFAQKSEVKAIEQTISAFAAAGDSNDADALAACLDDNFRVVMNRLFGSDQVSVLPRAVYLDKIRSKEFGGDQREVTVKNVLINGTTASAQVTYEGEKMTFVTITTLLKNPDGSWKLLSEAPVVM